MNLDFKHLLDPGFSPNSKVWIYQAARLLTIPEAIEAGEQIKKFTNVWLSHGDAVKAEGHLFFGRFLVLIADESQTHVGGCSTDSSQRFIRELGQQLGVDFFDRNALAFVVKDDLQVIPYSQVSYALENNFISPDTLYFNNLVDTKTKLEQEWIIPVKQSWLAGKLSLQ